MKRKIIKLAFILLMTVFVLFIANDICSDQLHQRLEFQSPRWRALYEIAMCGLPVIGNLLLFMDARHKRLILICGKKITPYVFAFAMSPFAVFCALGGLMMVLFSAQAIAENKDEWGIASATESRVAMSGYPIYIREAGDGILGDNCVQIEQRRPIFGNAEWVYWQKILYTKEDATKVVVTPLGHNRFECVFPADPYRSNRAERVVLENR